MATVSAKNPTVNSEVSGKGYSVLALTGCVSTILLLLGGWLTYAGFGPWYYDLNFPPFQPPAWLFTPVWTVVLSLLAWATWRISLQEGRSRGVGLALSLYGAQCILNIGWPLLFFTLRRPDIAFWEILALDITLLLMIAAYARVSPRAGLLLVPYLAWLLFSTAINGWIVQSNPTFDREARVSSSDSDQNVTQHAQLHSARHLETQEPSTLLGSVFVDDRSGNFVIASRCRRVDRLILHGGRAELSDCSHPRLHRMDLRPPGRRNRRSNLHALAAQRHETRRALEAGDSDAL